MQASRTTRNKKKRKGPAVLIVLLVLLVICGLVAGATYKYIKNFNEAFDPENTSTYKFEVPKGASTTKIANLLEESGLIAKADIFRYKSKFMEFDGTYQAGKFKLSPSMTMEEIMIALQTAMAESKKFTIPEGYTLWGVGQSLESNGIIESAEEFYDALEDDYDFTFLNGLEEYSGDYGFGGLSARANRLEGYLYPKTYEVDIDATSHDIINRMLSQFETEMNKLIKDEGIDNISLSSYSSELQEVLIKASIIEKEYAEDSDRPLISSVINNRLKKGMPMQIDATVQYAQGEFKERLLYEDLEIDSPYNTYVIKGLPVGPICSPSIGSIKAALMPEDTKYLYYVLKSDGSQEHFFTSDYNQFLQYKNEYLKNR